MTESTSIGTVIVFIICVYKLLLLSNLHHCLNLLNSKDILGLSECHQNGWNT